MHDETWRAAWYTDEVRALQDAVHRVYRDELAPLEARWTLQGEVDREVWQRAANAGLLCAGIAAEYGGLGATFAHEAMIYYERFRCGLPSFGNTVHSGIIAHYIARYGMKNKSAAGCRDSPLANGSARSRCPSRTPAPTCGACARPPYGEVRSTS